MDLKTTFNTIGIILNIVGVYMVYANSPIHHDFISGGDDNTDWKKVADQTKRKNLLLKYGVYVVIAGSVFQLASNFIPAQKL